MKVSLILVLLFSTAYPMSLDCGSYISSSGHYVCKVKSLTAKSPTDRTITSVNGTHQTGKTNNDVTLFKIENVAVPWLPDNLRNIFPNVNTLEAWNANLTSLSPSNFKNLPANLTQIRIQGNSIPILLANTFETNKKLKLLDIASNKIERVEYGAFNGQENLEKLDFWNNICGSVSESRTVLIPFAYIQIYLKCFDIYASFLNCDYQVDSNNSYKCRTIFLTIESFYQSKITDVSGAHLSKNINLDVDFFEATYKKIYFFPSNLHKFFPNLKVIRAHDVHLNEIRVDTFRSYPKIQQLLLPINRIKYLPSGCFSKNTNLKVLDLSQNLLFHVDNGVLTSLNKIYVLPNNCATKNAYDSSNAKALIPEIEANCKAVIDDGYCKLCSNSIACNSKNVLSSKCNSSAVAVKISDNLKVSILKSHNELRNKAAGGEISGIDRAARMYAMTYDAELENLAQLTCNKCDGSRDQCLETKKYHAIGQNIFKTTGKNETSAFANAFKSWSDQISIATKEDFKKFNSTTSLQNGLNLLKDYSFAIGCAVVRENAQDPNSNYWICCNYSHKNVDGEAVIKPGQIGSECPGEKHPSFKNLCQL